MSSYLLTITETASKITTNISVRGSELSVMLDNLQPATNYNVIIKTSNELGVSVKSPLVSFRTASKY